jgi:hypothetical protein
MNWRRWAKEPLFHFLLGGLAIYAVFAWMGDPPDPASRSIRVSQEDQAQLALGFEQMMDRPPTQAELDQLIDRWVHDEVLYREALRLGLDQNDPVIRRRLAQKMDIIAASAADAEQPSDAVLQKWLEAHPDRFTPDTALYFDQLYFGEEAGARAALARLKAGADWRILGEPVSLPRSLDAALATAVAEQFGDTFARALETFRPGDAWHGPIESPLGWHLVRLRDRKVGALPPLAKVRERVVEDWRAQTERQREDAGFKLLRDAYSVKIDK